MFLLFAKKYERAHLCCFYTVANIVTNKENDRNLNFALHTLKGKDKLIPYTALTPEQIF